LEKAKKKKKSVWGGPADFLNHPRVPFGGEFFAPSLDPGLSIKFASTRGKPEKKSKKHVDGVKSTAAHVRLW